jgi:hypothetical protein
VQVIPGGQRQHHAGPGAGRGEVILPAHPAGSEYAIVTPSLSKTTEPVIGTVAIAGADRLPAPLHCRITRVPHTSIAMTMTSRTQRP